MDKLSDVKLRNLAEPGKHFDGGGLYLEVTPAGGRYWRLKYRFAGKEKRLAFGVYPEVSLKLARERRADARAILDRGDDPGAAKREAKAQAERDAVNTFRSVAGAWLNHQSAKWATDTREAIRISLETHAFPKLADLPLANLRPRVVAGAPGRRLVRVPIAGHGLEGVAGVDQGLRFLGLLHLARVVAAIEQLAGVVAALAGFLQAHRRVHAEGQALFLAAVAVLQAKVAATGRRQFQVQAPTVEMLARSLQGAQLGIGQLHL